MKPIQIISQDLFDKVRSRFTNLEMGDETGAVTIDPAEARFFDFDFVNEGVNLGRVSISLNDLGSLKIYYSQGITENQDDVATKMWYNFLKEMRLFSMRRLLRFDTRDIAKTNLDKNDFQHLAATQGPKEEPDMNTMNESRWNHKSSRKTSRAVQGQTEVIVRHAHPVEETYPGARSQSKNIKAIFIQNRDGERFKYPFIHTAGAFAMAQHVDHGGVPHDPAGKAIIKMSENIAKLGEFQRHIQRSSLHADAHGIAERAIGHMNELKARVAAIGKRHHYEAWRQELEGMRDTTDEMVLDAVTLEDYKSKFTEINFQEELVGFFPLLHQIMSETNVVDLEEYVKESNEETEEGYNPNSVDAQHRRDLEASRDKDLKGKADSGDQNAAAQIKRREEKKDAMRQSHNDRMERESVGFEQFEEWADATEQGKLTDEQIQELKAAIETLPQGPNGPELDFDTAYNFFNQYGIDSDELQNKLQDEQQRASDIQATPLQIFQSWAKEEYPELLTSLGMGEEEPAPEGPPAEAPPPEAGAAPPAAPEQPVAESKGNKVVQEVAKIVKSFYNQSNESVGPFRAPENIALDCKKTVTEKFGEKAGEQAYEMAEAFINKLTQEWHQKHGHVKQNPVDHGDGLSVDSLKEILGRIKSKVEGISQPEMEEKDNWHPSKHVTDPQKKKELAPHDKDVQRGSYADRAAYLDKGGVLRTQEEKNPQHSHQYDTTMKHADNPTYQQRMAAHDIKPGIAGYRDRIDMLKDLERTGKLKNAQEEGSKQDFRTHGMDSKPSRENPAGNPPPTDWKKDPIAAATDRAYDAGKSALQRLAGIRKK